MIRNKAKNLALLISLAASSCSDDQKNRDPKLEVTLWADFNQNEKYDIGEDVGVLGDDPVYMANKGLRVLYKGNPNQEVNLSIVSIFPYKEGQDYVFNSQRGTVRIEDDSKFVKSLNELVKKPGVYTVIAKPLNEESFVYETVNSAYPDDFFEIMKEQRSWSQEYRPKDK